MNLQTEVEVDLSAWRPYTEKDDKDMARLAKEGLSAAEIGKIINRTKNSVISRTKRNGVRLDRSWHDAKAMHAKRARLSTVKRPTKPKVIKKPAPEPKIDGDRAAPQLYGDYTEIDKSKAVDIMHLGSGCKFPLFKTDEWMFCGLRRGASQTYCVEHERICYQPLRKRVK